uniref:NADH-ubiquinone oxidoreductase chain 4L n=1 Tax=Kraemeria cunicularia TaxID=86209 RepID=A0A347Z6I8_9GOBI|nr:NADH dehydrogenase subunit 4L [Kraemeria cunicularia]BBA12779.1 NADH dehydrogenase subunit 4L [Kraemeria cunicularia]
MTPLHFVFSAAFITGTAGLAFHRTHLLSSLLCLEGMMLSLFLGLSLWALQTTSANFCTAPLILLALSACEASAGLSLLVATSRTHGSDHLKALTILQC